MAHDIAMNITSKIVALSSAVAFALQTTLALLMLRYFSPEEVGIFSVISQIGFFWTTLALAQAPLQLLANHEVSVLDDARRAWYSSMLRFIFLLPVVALAIWWSGLPFVITLMWAIILSLCQLTWMLAQSMRLRMRGAWSLAGVRVFPPLMALLVTTLAILMHCSGSSLLVAALTGYASGAAWFLPSLYSAKQLHLNRSHQTFTPISGDDRSSTLRMAHTLVDALLATGLFMVWQRLYGAEETGLMAAPLRVMGFVPAVLHVAWTQVLLAQPQQGRANPLFVGLGGFACVALMGAACVFALEMGWLDSQWQGVRPYVLPLVFWQGSACVVAAFSYLAFQRFDARTYSWICIGLASLQGIFLLGLALIGKRQPADSFFNWFAALSAIGLFGLSIWLNHKRT